MGENEEGLISITFNKLQLEIIKDAMDAAAIHFDEELGEHDDEYKAIQETLDECIARLDDNYKEH